MKKVLIIVLSVLLIVSITANGYFCYKQFFYKEEEKSLTRSFEDIVGISLEDITKVKVHNGDAGGQTIEITNESLFVEILDNFKRQDYMYSYTITEDIIGCPYSVTFHTKSGNEYSVYLYGGGFEINKDVYVGMRNKNLDGYFKLLDWPKHTEKFIYIFTEPEYLKQLVVTDRILKKQITITSEEQLNRFYEGFSGEYERTSTIYHYGIDHEFTDYRYQIDFYGRDEEMKPDELTMFRTLITNGLSSNRLFVDNSQTTDLYTKLGTDIDWSVFTELDWKKAEDIKE